MNTNANARTAGEWGSGRMRGVLHEGRGRGERRGEKWEKWREGCEKGTRVVRFARHVARVDPASSRSTDWSAFPLPPPPLPPFVSGSFSVAATPSGPAVTLASTTISTERGRRYSVSVLVEPPDTDTTINGDADGVSGFHRIFRLSAVFLLLS